LSPQRRLTRLLALPLIGGVVLAWLANFSQQHAWAGLALLAVVVLAVFLLCHW